MYGWDGRAEKGKVKILRGIWGAKRMYRSVVREEQKRRGVGLATI